MAKALITKLNICLNCYLQLLCLDLVALFFFDLLHIEYRIYAFDHSARRFLIVCSSWFLQQLWLVSDDLGGEDAKYGGPGVVTWSEGVRPVECTAKEWELLTITALDRFVDNTWEKHFMCTEKVWVLWLQLKRNRSKNKCSAFISVEGNSRHMPWILWRVCSNKDSRLLRCIYACEVSPIQLTKYRKLHCSIQSRYHVAITKCCWRGHSDLPLSAAVIVFTSALTLPIIASMGAESQVFNPGAAERCWITDS